MFAGRKLLDDAPGADSRLCGEDFRSKFLSQAAVLKGAGAAEISCSLGRALPHRLEGLNFQHAAVTLYCESFATAGLATEACSPGERMTAFAVHEKTYEAEAWPC